MINIEKNTPNTVVLTLTEKATLPTPYFLFKFTNTVNIDNEVIFTAPDSSVYKSRYNIFDITESGTTYNNLTGGTITLEPNGMWDYVIYEQVNEHNLSLTGVTSIVEVGKVIVTGTDNTIPEVYK